MSESLLQESEYLPANPTSIYFKSDINSKFIDYGLRMIETFCGIRIEDGETKNVQQPPDIYYGNDQSQIFRIRIPYVPQYTRENIRTLKDEFELQEDAASPEITFPFDLFSAIYFWLTDEGNRNLLGNIHDIHDRLIAEHSFQEEFGLMTMPPVNAYLMLLRRCIETRLNKKVPRFLPSGKRCAVILSHDVDNPINPDDFAHTFWIAYRLLNLGRLRSSLSHSKLGLIRAAQRLRHKASISESSSKRVSANSRYWLFDEIMDSEDQYGFKSTFFFSCVPGVAHGADTVDVGYDASSPRFRKLFRRIAARGFETGLHISYNGRNLNGQIAAEKVKLESLAGTRIRGSRHHYWHLKRSYWETLDEHAEAGLKFDSSLAFNDRAGFRLGIAFPYYPWHPEHDRMIPTLQIPFLAMDGAFFYQPGMTAEVALREMQDLLNCLKDYEGVASINWHARTSYPGSEEYREWGMAYLRILKMLAADSEICVYNCAELLDRFENWMDSIK